MRLLQYSSTSGFCFTEDYFEGGKVPSYAILSHTWGRPEDEVTFDDILNGTGQDKGGYDKIRYCGEQARRDGLQVFWVDTCCINKSSSADLSYAINSMFRWYSEAKVCYAFLTDVRLPAGERAVSLDDNSVGALDLLRPSKWFTRGWTLQELLAPDYVIFYDETWARITDKISCRNTISSITGIPPSVLERKFYLWYNRPRRSPNDYDTPVVLWATILHWCCNRETSRPEDIAYCLFGLFDVNLPLLYGEGQADAFQRLQHEMVKRTSSNSLLAWNLDSELCVRSNGDLETMFLLIPTPLLIFAGSPRQFANTPTMDSSRVFSKQVSDYEPWIVSNLGIELGVLLISNEAWYMEEPFDDHGIQNRYDFAVAILPFRLPSNVIEYIGFLLAGNSRKRVYSRVATPNGSASFRVSGRMAAKAKSQIIFLSDRPAFCEIRAPSSRSRVVYFESTEFQVQDTILSRCDWKSEEQCLLLESDDEENVQEALLKIASKSNEGSKSIFYLLLSNSIVSQDAMPTPQPKSNYWHFRTPGIAVVPDNLACRLFDDIENGFLPQRIVEVESQDITIRTSNSLINATLTESGVELDLIYSLIITRSNKWNE